jgi:hypothetical protein
MIYEVVVSPWTLILWVLFRAVEVIQPGSLQAFFDTLRHSPDLVAWDDEDDSFLTQTLAANASSAVSIYPASWHSDMVAINPEDWLTIRTMTWTPAHRHHKQDKLTSTRIRFLGLCLEYSARQPSTVIPHHDLLAPMGIRFEPSIFTSMVQGITGNYRRTAPMTFDSHDFWVCSNLEHWLSDRREELCYTVWHANLSPSTFERAECMYFSLGMPAQVCPKLLRSPQFHH